VNVPFIDDVFFAVAVMLYEQSAVTLGVSVIVTVEPLALPAMVPVSVPRTLGLFSDDQSPDSLFELTLRSKVSVQLQSFTHALRAPDQLPSTDTGLGVDVLHADSVKARIERIRMRRIPISAFYGRWR
jgi:hypothetical protein